MNNETEAIAKARAKWKTLDRACTDPDLTSGAVKLFTLLVTRCDKKTDECILGHQKLAKLLHCDESHLTVRVRGQRKGRGESWISQLVDGGYISVEKRNKHRGFRYTLHFSENSTRRTPGHKTRRLRGLKTQRTSRLSSNSPVSIDPVPLKSPEDPAPPHSPQGGPYVENALMKTQAVVTEKNNHVTDPSPSGEKGSPQCKVTLSPYMGAESYAIPSDDQVRALFCFPPEGIPLRPVTAKELDEFIDTMAKRGWQYRGHPIEYWDVFAIERFREKTNGESVTGNVTC